MAHFLRAKQAGIQSDFSAGITSELFALDDIARYGINSQVSTLAYDPVQSLLAVGTNESQYGSGQIYVFGQKRVSVTLNLPRRASVKILQFCADKLISVDSKHDVAIFSLEHRRLVATYAPPGYVTSLLTDSSLDYAFLGLQNGEVIAYDLDREAVAPFKIPNFWKDQNPKARILPVVSVSLHPRDVGTLLIGYTEGAVIYSFKQNKPIKYFQYELPPGAPGGDSDPSSVNMVRRPRLTQATWHPTGTFILTGHEDSSLVIWDVAKDGRMIMARTLTDCNVHKPGTSTTSFGSAASTFSVKEPLFRIAWCSKQNPDDTGLLIAGGAPTTLPTKGLTFLDLGPTPNYATSSWQILSDHFDSPKRQRILPTPPKAEVVDFCLIPRSSPHFAGSHDPIAVLTLLSSGEIVTLSFPSGHPISPTNQLHVSLSYVHPFIGHIDLASIDRMRWLGMTEKRPTGPPILKGGAEATHPLKRYESRNTLQTAHADGTVRVWDAGHGDEIENEDALQIDVGRALGRFENLDVTHMSIAGATGELAIGMRTGELAVFRWAVNRNFGREGAINDFDDLPGTRGLTDIMNRAEPGLKEGLVPFTLLSKGQGSVTTVKMSDVGFVAAGFEDGSISVIDLRGPAIIFEASLSDLSKHNKRGSIRRSNTNNHHKSEWPTVMEFGVMSLDGDDYSSILLFVGTNLGRIATFKLLPESSGGHSVHFAGSTSLDDCIISISPINADTGVGASAQQSAVANLRHGFKVNGVLLAVSQTGARIFKPVSAKGASKTWDESLCDSAKIARLVDRGSALVGLFRDGRVRAYSIPGLKEFGHAKISHVLDIKRFSEAIVTESGDVFGWTGPSEVAVLNVWGTGQALPSSSDKLYNTDAVIPPRPTISNLQWISGTQYITPADMDILIGGPDRPPLRRMIEQSRADEQQRRLGGRMPANSSSAAAGAQEEGYWAYMQRQMNERTEKLGIMGDSMDRLEENSSGWADDVSKFVQQQKRRAVLGVVKGKLGL
ncbi:MAG: hypothetical protein M1827_000175 [Pycnora praestabilis]|nr:MAG: hypothetical protein M1827_000175 [Pycnora praestabilis]